MQTRIITQILASSNGQEAHTILRNCVHCGFCTATCPTYLLLGNELDSPRGRIYLIKQLLEGEKPSPSVQRHLDTCLLCRSCETTCPSGVNYSRLYEIGQQYLNEHQPRSWHDKAKRWALRKILPQRKLFHYLLRLGQLVKPVLPRVLGHTIPSKETPSSQADSCQKQSRKMLILDGCVQPSLAPRINLATAQVLEQLGISLIRTPQAGCCGAIEHHLDDTQASQQAARVNIDLWWPQLQEGAEALVITASGCAQMIKEYDRLLKDDPQYAKKAQCVAKAAKDISEILHHEAVEDLRKDKSYLPRIAFHTPCTLQHGQQLGGVVESILIRLGFQLLPVADPHLCCGSAGTYSILQPKLAKQLGQRKSSTLTANDPHLIATANIGCLMHLRKNTPAEIPVIHWIELLAYAMSNTQST
jgi:glycolate oxidase iron-sulfur subunit